MQRSSQSAFKLGLLAAALSLAAASAIASDPKASKYYEDALQRFEKQDHKGAIVQLKNALKLDRKLLPVHVLLGRALLANGELNAAEAAFDEALKIGVNPTEIVLALAETVSAQGKPGLLLTDARFAHAGLPADMKTKLLLFKAGAASDTGQGREALKFIEEARALTPNSADSWIAEVPVRVRARQLAEAKVAADKAVALDPKSSPAAYQQATVAHVSGDLKAAVAMYTRTLGLKAEHVDARVARAGIQFDLGEIDAASTDVQAARKADPKDPRSAYLAALLFERKGQAAEAKKALLEVTNLLDPFPVEYLRYRPQLLMLGGMSHFALDQFEKAKPYLEMVVRQDANSAVSKLLARIYLLDKRPDKAVEALEAFLRTRPGERQATLLLASTLMAQGKHARAGVLMEAALKKSDDPSMRSLLGQSLVGAGKFAVGAAELEATLKKDPGQVQAGVSLAGILIASGQGGKAVTVVEGLVKRLPQHPGLASLLGSALLAKGDAVGARASFERALKLDPAFSDPKLSLARLDINERAYDSAQTRLNALLAKNEKDIDALLEVARLFNIRGKPDEAQRWLQRADDSSGARLQPGLMLVDFFLAQGNPVKAREPLRRLQGKAPEALMVMLAQARVQLANSETKEAQSTLNRASTLMAYDAAALTEIAEMQIGSGNLPGAAHALDKALSAVPTHLRARGMRSSLFLQQGDAAKAEQVARSILASDPKIGLGHGLLADIARTRKQMPAAIELYKRAHQLDQSSDSLLRLFSALDISQPAEAVSLAEGWLKNWPADQRSWRALADSQARRGQMPAARAAYESLIKLAPLDAEALNNLAVVMVSLGDTSAAKLADRALALKPQSAHIIGTAGWAAFHAGQPDRALQLLRDARLRDPNNAGTRYFLGAVLAQQGRKGEAKTEVEAALASGAGFAYAREAETLLKTLR